MSIDYIRLSEEEGNRFVRNNEYRLEGDFFMDYCDYYNRKEINKIKTRCDKNWYKAIVIRKNVYDSHWSLNPAYKDWLNAPDVPEEIEEPLSPQLQLICDFACKAFDDAFKRDALKCCVDKVNQDPYNVKMKKIKIKKPNNIHETIEKWFEENINENK